MALVRARVLFVFPDLRTVAQRRAERLDAGKPLVLPLLLVVDLAVGLQDGAGVLRGDVLGQGMIRNEGLVKEVAQVVRDLLPFCDVLAGLRHVAVDVQDRGRIGRISSKAGMELRRVCLRPFRDARVDRCGVHAADDVLADVSQLGKVEQAAARTHFFEVERKIYRVRSRIRAPPVLKI